MQKDGNMSREATHHAKFNTEQEAYEFARKTLGQYYQVFSETMYVSN